MLFAEKWPKMRVFERVWNSSDFFKRCENDPKSIKTMGYSPCFLLRNGQKWAFLKGVKFFRFFQKVWKWPKIDQNHGLYPLLFAQKWPKMRVFERVWNSSLFLKRCENDPKWIKTMGYSPCFLLRNGQKWGFFKGCEILQIFSKGVKMTQNRSKTWAIGHAFCSKMAKNDHFWKGDKFFIVLQKVWKWPKIDQNHGL